MSRRIPTRAILASGLCAAGLLAGVVLPSSLAAATGPSSRTGNRTVSLPAAVAVKRPAPAFPVTVATPYGALHVAHRPTRIVSLSPTATEMLYAVGAGREVVAVDNDSTYPKHIPRTTLSGYTPNVEAIAGYHPDLVIISYNPTPPNLVASLRLLGIPVLYLPAANDLAQSYAQIDEIGRVTGDAVPAADLVRSMRSQIARLSASVRRRPRQLTYFYELDPTLYSATGNTFIGSVLSHAGLRDITGASVHGNDYPQLSPEAVLHANPTFIFLADGASVRSVDARPGWSLLGAVRTHRVVELNEDVASRWGPRIVDLLAEVVRAVDKVPPTGAP